MIYISQLFHSLPSYPLQAIPWWLLWSINSIRVCMYYIYCISLQYIIRDLVQLFSFPSDRTALTSYRTRYQFHYCIHVNLWLILFLNKKTDQLATGGNLTETCGLTCMQTNTLTCEGGLSDSSEIEGASADDGLKGDVCEVVPFNLFTMDP